MRIPLIMPIKGRRFINQGSGLCFKASIHVIHVGCVSCCRKFIAPLKKIDVIHQILIRFPCTPGSIYLYKGNYEHVYARSTLAFRQLQCTSAVWLKI